MTASAAHKAVKALNLDVNEKRGFKTFRTYGNSKLANILFTQSLAAKLKEKASQKSQIASPPSAPLSANRVNLQPGFQDCYLYEDLTFPRRVKRVLFFCVSSTE